MVRKAANDYKVGGEEALIQGGARALDPEGTE